jgi:hypothetical protein
METTTTGTMKGVAPGFEFTLALAAVSAILVLKKRS